MSAGADRPRLVPLEATPVELQDGSQAIALRDPWGVLEGAAVSPAGWWVLAHLDGTRTAADVSAALAAHGARISAADVERIVAQARDAGLVHGPAYERKRAAALGRLRAGPRAPACAGGVYSADPAELDAAFRGFFEHADGPGAAARDGAPRGHGVRLLVAPHIDYHRGGPSYAHAYGALRGCDADLYVVFGTAHASPPRLFTLTRQPFETPLGAVAVDAGVADALARELGEEELFGDELVHVNEHSVELQVVWLRWLFGAPLRILPVLCASISHLDDPAAATAPFLAALARATAGRKVCFVAGADLAHAGPQYGDEAAVHRAALDALGAEDRRTLAFLERGDAAGFHRDAVRDDERRRLCGTAPIYAAMRAAGRAARLLDHRQWWDGTDTVSFCAAAG